MKNKLILFTADFPYGTGETFLETEIVYLAKGFDEVKIISQNNFSKECRSLPDNCSVDRIKLSISAADKIKALLGVLNPLFWKERSVIKYVYGKHLTKGILFTMLISLYRAKKVEKRVQSLVTSKGNSKQVFYSYWCDDVAIGLALAKANNDELICVSRIHGWDVYFEVSALAYLPFRHLIANHLNTIYPISEKGIAYAKESWKLNNTENFQLARLGVLPQQFTSNSFKRFTIVSCSNLIALKRVHLIIEALSKLEALYIDWFHFGDGPLLPSLENQAKDLLPSTINYAFMGRVSNQKILEWYKECQADLFINVSSSEGIPVSIMEAMSFGIPTIATNVGGTRELVDDICGKLISANPDVNEIADAIAEFYNLSSEQLQLKKAAALKKWELDFNAEKNYQSFTSMLIKS